MTTAKIFEAISYAATHHRGQMRRDGKTPYMAHPFRVMMVVRQIFQIDDEEILIAAVLHDTIEDTQANYEEIKKLFGEQVAQWVVLLTKEEGPSKEESKANYLKKLVSAPDQVKWIKLADIFDNLNDSAYFPPEKRAKTQKKSREYLDVVYRNPVHPTTIRAKGIVEEVLKGESSAFVL